MGKVAVRFSLKSDQEPKLMVEGIPGGKCVDVSRPFLSILGGEITSFERTGEFYYESPVLTDLEVIK
jgi:hypothetical protein